MAITGVSADPFVMFNQKTTGTREDQINNLGQPPFVRNVVLDGSSGTFAKNICQIQGTIEATIQGRVLNNLSSNITGVYLRMLEGSNETLLTEKITGAALSSLPIGSWLGIMTDSSGTLVKFTSAQVNVFYRGGLKILYPIGISSKAGTNCYLQIVYTTTDAPCSGQLEFSVQYEKRDSTGNVIGAP